MWLLVERERDKEKGKEMVVQEQEEPGKKIDWLVVF